MQEVTGSIPVISTRKKSTAQECAVLFCCVCPAMQLLNSCWTFAESYGIILSAIAGIVHRLVYQPSKLRRWVRFPLPAPCRKGADSFRIGAFCFACNPLCNPLYFLYPEHRSGQEWPSFCPACQERRDPAGMRERLFTLYMFTLKRFYSKIR